MSIRVRIIFYTHTDPHGCWTWRAARDRYGYGTIAVDRKKRPAHRVSYSVFRGPIPEGMVIDHLCRNRACVNPWHMEPVTNEENVNRGLRSGAKTHCVNSHEYTPENTYARPDSGKRKCRACNAAAVRRSQARKRAAA
jgi:hypothetical protein